MMGMAAALSKEDMADLAAYFSSQNGLTIVKR
jgi:cytochrome c553